MEKFTFSPQVKQALNSRAPVVALESTVITHGLPHPTNYKTAFAMEQEVINRNAIPATICMIEGQFHVGISDQQLQDLSKVSNSIKISRKDIAFALANRQNGGTTVSGTMTVANSAGIKVFATGGIGGVHRGNFLDVSADLPTLAQIPMIVVCSGAKSILDISATKERLETSGVPVLGYQTDELPAFYSINSGIKVDYKVNSAEEVVTIARSHWEFGMTSAILVTVPLSKEEEIPADMVMEQIEKALEEAKSKGIGGPQITPFLLTKVSEKTKGKSMAANIALLKNNARVAADIASALSAVDR